jgi:hypothetical protein
MDNEKQVVVTGLNIPFWDLVVFLIKLAFASIPALFVVSFFFMLMGMLFGNMMFFANMRGF